MGRGSADKAASLRALGALDRDPGVRNRPFFGCRALGVLVSIAVAALSVSPAVAAVPGNGRAWELVTPSEPVSAIFSRPLALNPAGTRLAYLSLGAMPGAPAGDFIAATVAIRGGDGWKTEPVGSPYSSQGKAGAAPTLSVAFDKDVSASIWLADVPLIDGSPPEGTFALYRRSASGGLTLLVVLGASEPTWVRASDDVQRVFFTSAEHLLSADAGRTEGESIYEISNGGLRLIDVNGAGEELSPCGATVHAVSETGERVFFTSRGSACAGPSRVYLREGGETTVDIGESRCTRVDCNSPQDVLFAGATPSGSSAFLVTAQQLVNADTDEANDLYRYDVNSGELDLLSAGPDEAGGSFEHIAAFSRDGTQVYFFATGRLISGQGSEEGSNLYLTDETGLHFLVALSNASVKSAADGGAALVDTSEALVEGDTDGLGDIYRYDVGAERFSLLSTGSIGGDGPFAATSESELSEEVLPAVTPVALHAFSDDGERAFFTTAERLVPEDGNESTDLYEWTAGTVALLSGGRGAGKVQFAGASADGHTALFETSASLLPADRDGGEHDIYAARIGGGFDEPALEPECRGVECFPSGPREEILRRPALASLGPPPGGKRGMIRIRRFDVAASDGIVRTGRANAFVVAPGPGLIEVRGTTRVGDRVRTVVDGSAGALRAGAVRVPLRFAASVRRRLAGGLVVPIRFALSQPGTHAVSTMRLKASGKR